jgi:hypothetical protein
MGSTGNDPRPDQHERPHQSPNPGESKTYPAEGGAGTGTKTDPAKNTPEKKP